MTQRTFIKCIQTWAQDGSTLRLEYYLLTDYAGFDGAPLELYGVEILLYRPGSPRPECGRIRGITPTGSRALQLLQCLSDGAVTPVGLRDVVEDFLAEPLQPRIRSALCRPFPMR